MKRSALKRTQPLARATASLRRSKGLRRTKPHRSRAKAQGSILSRETIILVNRRQHGLCACGCGGRIAPFPIGYHHIFPKARWPELIDVAENVIGTTANCHANHETAAKRFTLQAVASVKALRLDARQFAYLARTYRLV